MKKTIIAVSVLALLGGCKSLTGCSTTNRTVSDALFDVKNYVYRVDNRDFSEIDTHYNQGLKDLATVKQIIDSEELSACIPDLEQVKIQHDKLKRELVGGYERRKAMHLLEVEAVEAEKENQRINKLQIQQGDHLYNLVKSGDYSDHESRNENDFTTLHNKTHDGYNEYTHDGDFVAKTYDSHKGNFVLTSYKTEESGGSRIFQFGEIASVMTSCEVPEDLVINVSNPQDTGFSQTKITDLSVEIDGVKTVLNPSKLDDYSITYYKQRIMYPDKPKDRKLSWGYRNINLHESIDHKAHKPFTEIDEITVSFTSKTGMKVKTYTETLSTKEVKQMLKKTNMCK